MKRADAPLYARTQQHRARVHAARWIVASALTNVPSWYVALSGGKDSTCVLHLVREQAPDTAASNSTYEWMMPETRDYLDRVPNLRRVATPTDHRTGWAPNWRCREDAERAYPGILWAEPRPGERVGQYEHGVFLGLRADEAVYRRIHLATSGTLFFCERTDQWHCNPIAKWSVLDVWAYIQTCGIDYNRAYDRMEEIGVPLEHQRIGPLAVQEALPMGQLAILKRGWPELWNRYAAAHPEARAYA